MYFFLFPKLRSSAKYVLILIVVITISLNLFLRDKIIKNTFIENQNEYSGLKNIKIIREDIKNIPTSVEKNFIIPPKYFRNYSKLLPFEFYSIDYRKENKMLQRGLSLNEYENLMSLVEIIVTILSRNDMEFFIGYGTQLGNY
jgi:hypothetical protein